MTKNLAADPLSLMLWLEVEMLNPLRVEFRPDGDHSGIIPVDLDHECMGRVERIQETFPDAAGIPTAQPFQIWAHDPSSELCHPASV